MCFRITLGVACAVVLSAGSVWAQCSDPVGEWTFNDGTLTDTSGHGNNGVNFGATLVPGVSGTGLGLSGAGQYAQIPDSPSLNPTSAMTVMAWYRGVDFVGTGNDPIVDKGYYGHSYPYYQYHLGVTGTQYGHDTSSFGFDLAVNGNPVGVSSPFGTWVPGVWYHIVGTYDGAAMKLYINGKVVNQAAMSGPIHTYGQPVRIGKFDNLGDCLPGTVDDVRIYDRALSPEEVLLWYLHPEGTALVTPLASSVCSGGSAEFQVTTVEQGPQTYQWRRDGQPLAEVAGHFVGTQSRVLTVVGAMPDDVGAYDCVVTGTCGSHTSSAGTLAICAADYNCDAFLDIYDFTDFVTCFEGGDCPPGKSADFNADGFPDIYDFTDFVDAFEVGC